MDYLLHVDDCLIIEMVLVSLKLRYSRISWMLIDFVLRLHSLLPFKGRSKGDD